MNFACWFLFRSPFHPRVTAVARRRPRSFCQKCKWQVTHKHAYTLDPTKSEWTDYADLKALCGNLSGNKLTRNSSGNTRPQSSQLAELLWTDSGLRSGVSVRDLISSLNNNNNNNNKSQAGNGLSNILPEASRVRKKPCLLYTSDAADE